MALSKAALFAAAALVLTGAMPAVRAKEMAAAPAAGVEGRPSPADASPLQARVDAAAPGSKSVPEPTRETSSWTSRPSPAAGYPGQISK